MSIGRWNRTQLNRMNRLRFTDLHKSFLEIVLLTLALTTLRYPEESRHPPLYQKKYLILRVFAICDLPNSVRLENI